MLAVGAPLDSSGAIQGGAAYIYELKSGRWILAASLTAPDAAPGDLFSTVSASDEVVAVGAAGDDDQGPNSGSVYLFDRRPDGWQFHSKLLPIGGSVQAGFGQFLSISAGRLVVAAPFAADYGFASGAVHEFRRHSRSTDWLQVGRLIPSDVGPQSKLGAVAVCGDAVVVGSTKGLDPGAAHIFGERLGRTSTTFCEGVSGLFPECSPTIATLGAATASGTGQFIIRGLQVPGLLVGVFLYTHGPMPSPIENVSGMCLPGLVAGRSALLGSNGTFGECDGTLELNWNDLLAAQAGKDPLLTQPGSIIYGQFVYFAFGSTARVGFTDAVAFITCP